MKTKCWCCVGYNFKEAYYNWQSLSSMRSTCIKKHTGNSNWNWREWEKRGWKCIKVEVEIKPIGK